MILRVRGSSTRWMRARRSARGSRRNARMLMLCFSPFLRLAAVVFFL